MAKMTLEDLRKLREEKKKSLGKRDLEGKTAQIVVGMGTCGISAGAKDALNAFIKAVDANNLDHVIVTQTGCMGLCYVEPTVEVLVDDMPNVIYGNVTPDVAERIVKEHVMHKRMVNEHVFDRPAADIMKDGGK
ncbi:MAG: (2Fe-2S) ferredoxin domain-containing protein [Spirochaetota bacterium]